MLMKVNPKQLQNGCIIARDVQLLSNQVLVRKKTVISDEHIEAIQAFLVDEVEVEAKLVNGEPFKPTEVIEEEKKQPGIIEQKGFLHEYLDAVKAYKKLFNSWQAGMKVEIINVRKILLPLIEKLDENPEELLSIHHYASKEDYISHHAVAVGVLSAFLGRKLNLGKADIIQLGISGAMADAGMSKVSSALLSKKGSLTKEDFDEIKKHPMYSYQMLKGLPGVTDGVLLAVLQHHEREDGTGYPLSVGSNKLHRFSKIIAVIDVFHAMTSERSYKAKKSPFKVIEEITKDNFGKFDHTIVQTLCNCATKFTVGTKVRLNNDEIGEVVFIEPNSPIRPMIKIEATGEFIKLTNRHDLYIEEIIN